MDKARVERMEKVISQGRLRFILFRGVLGWGIPTAVLFTLFQYFTGTPQTLITIAISMITFPIGGLLFGFVMWAFFRRQYAKNCSTEL